MEMCVSKYFEGDRIQMIFCENKWVLKIFIQSYNSPFLFTTFTDWLAPSSSTLHKRVVGRRIERSKKGIFMNKTNIS